MKPILGLVVPCYNEEAVLRDTLDSLKAVVADLVTRQLVDPASRIYCVDDGSRDNTWQIIQEESLRSAAVCGVKLAGNVGHQNALMAGLSTATADCDIMISIDADLQDDTAVIADMVNAYLDGADIVYGVRKSRESDSFFKRNSALMFYKMMNAL